MRRDVREKDHVPKDKSIVGRPEQDGHCANSVELRDGGSALRRLFDVGRHAVAAIRSLNGDGANQQLRPSGRPLNGELGVAFREWDAHVGVIVGCSIAVGTGD